MEREAEPYRLLVAIKRQVPSIQYHYGSQFIITITIRYEKMFVERLRKTIRNFRANRAAESNSSVGEFLPKGFFPTVKEGTSIQT